MKKIILMSRRNSLGDITAPTLNTITIEDANPTDVVMTFDEAVTGTNLGFTIAGTTESSFASISGSGTTTITGVLATAAVEDETITLSYSKSTGDFVDDSSNELEDITNQSVTNNVISYGPELIGDPGFDDAGYWSISASWAISGSKATATSSGSGDGIGKVGVLTIGKTYRMEVTLSNYSGTGDFAFRISGWTARFDTNGTHVETLEATSTEFKLNGYNPDGSGDFDDISVKEVL